MKLWQDYIIPTTIDETLQIMDSAPGRVAIIAGGTDLLIEMTQGKRDRVDTLIDINSVAELNRIEINNNHLIIGAATRINEIALSTLVGKHALALVDACKLIGGPQVRNMATLGGNVAHALPAADGMIALMCLDTHVVVANKRGRRIIPLERLFLAPGRTSLVVGEDLIIEFQIPLMEQGQSSVFKRIMKSQGIALPIINISICLRQDGEFIKEIRVVCGPSGNTPQRMKEVENFLVGRKVADPPDYSTMAELINDIPFRSSPRRASAKYRHHLLENLLEDALTLVIERSQQHG